MKNFFKIGKSYIGDDFPTYFIADIGANHDGNLDRAIQLIRAANISPATRARASLHILTS